MPTKISYQGPGPGEDLVAYCVESPDVVLQKVFRDFRVWEYKGQEQFLVPSWTGLIINSAEDSVPGTTITDSIDSLGIESLVLDSSSHFVHREPLSDLEVKYAIFGHLMVQFTENCSLKVKDNYIVNFDNEGKRALNEDWFKEKDSQMDNFLEATKVMIDVGDRERLRNIFMNAYWYP